MRLQDRVAVVTGGGRGIGREIVLSLVDEGARVAVVDLDYETACKVRDEVAASGGEAIAIKADITKKDEVDALANQVVATYGHLDIWVNNAGVNTVRRFLDLPEEHWDLVMDVNAKGVFLGCQAAARHMVDQEAGGRIINISSQAGVSGFSFFGHYSASKFAVVGLTQALAKELGPLGVTVNAICPGDVDTEMLHLVLREVAKLRRISYEQVLQETVDACPLGRLESPKDVARAVTFLASDEAGFITGEALNVSGGREMH